jgi:hypothetical protein
MSTPASANVRQSAASSGTCRPCGFIAALVSGRFGALSNARMPAMPWRGPGKSASTSPGTSSPANVTSSHSEALPNTMLTNCARLAPIVCAAIAMSTRKRPASDGSIATTRATISSRMRASPIASSGHSTLCSEAIAAARASMSRSGHATM